MKNSAYTPHSRQAFLDFACAQRAAGCLDYFDYRLMDMNACLVIRFFSKLPSRSSYQGAGVSSIFQGRY